MMVNEIGEWEQLRNERVQEIKDKYDEVFGGDEKEDHDIDKLKGVKVKHKKVNYQENLNTFSTLLCCRRTQ